MPKIPRLLFQTWKDKNDIPEDFAYWADTLKTENPNYAYRLWDDADNRAFIAKNFPWFLERYDGFPAEIYRADAVRYFFLYQYGGIYADMDLECIRPLDQVIEFDADVVLGRMGVNDTFEHGIPNAFMASAPKQEFWLLCMSLMLDTPERLSTERPEYRTGPVLLKLAHDLYRDHYRDDSVLNRIASIRAKLESTANDKSRVVALSGNYFFPVDWNDQIHETFFRRPMQANKQRLTREQVQALFPNSFTVTYWSHSWEEQ